MHYTIIPLIRKHITGEITGEERETLARWIDEHHDNKAFFDRVTSGNGITERERFFRQTDKQRRLREFDRLIGYRKRRALAAARYYAAAAIVVIALLVWQAWPVPREIPAGEHAAIKPGSTRATLTVSDGTVFSLQSGGSQPIDAEGIARVDSTRAGIVYADRPDKSVRQRRDILRTSRGGEYRVYLPDGSMVYLNADTRLEYPVPFDADKREVQLSGEAYFEIAKERERPFHVIVDGIRVQVHGTTFAMSTREKDGIQTVLIEGSIGIQSATTGKEIMMSPGQLALFSREGELLALKHVNVYPYIAWKDGKFIFEEEELEHIMQTLSLWYDVEIAYLDDTIRRHPFTGHLRRYDDIYTILNAIAQIIDVDFEVNGRVITVKDTR
ncbi:MAG: FecR domain-containing protein [Odoribacteraceae bacterium]|jgi:ferric-dicitrate binding protein FerR (iron transport regulator)|nr:FecR domain-containing protein [Odoribacteraceae bacterium]